jgi:prepilin-type N-terminal cleavage/methylation domain-containing protein
MKGGFTLIELMICVALTGILAAGGMVSAVHLRERSAEEVQRVQALLALEAHAERIVAGGELPPALAARALEPLPDARLETLAHGPFRTLTVRWRTPTGGWAERALTVFAAPAAP